ncbi:MmgE/PrpD family protein [Exilibacterium tricleocarpae]|uniref:MmgE/PrpD family protein n=1 Tax=Exilibacterium tricleocarpae TaxID=2591008 RepID=A0A545SSR0_9GAMM|nr:MmgE/PrpD family protein [Exilibacterium tricleocarpae]TQV68010.1 MmgE/PrpD family protein [Exilibacterium tricleocarpae]
MNISREMVRFAKNLYNSKNIYLQVSEKSKMLMLDQLGLQIGCADLEWCRSVYEYTQKFSIGGSSTIVYYGKRTTPELAAFSNSTFGHGQDYDDTCLKVQTHPSAVVLPVALAIGEEVKAKGYEVFKAYIAGLEIVLRIAHSVSPGCLQRGHHTPQACGPYGAAVTAGLLLELTEDQLVNAMGIAGSFSGGLIEYTQSGGSVKRIHTAIPTTAGIRAAYLAQMGLTGPETVLDGKKGFCAVYSDTSDVSRLLSKIGEKFIIDYVATKKYNCCYFIHAPMEATLELVKKHSIDLGDIVEIAVGTSHHGVVHVGKIVEPHDELGAQFSVQFSTAMALLKEIPGIHSYTPEILYDLNILNLARRFRIYEDVTCSQEYPENWGAVVTIRTDKKIEYTKRVRFAKGTPENPMNQEELVSKFRRNVKGIISDKRCQSLIDAILNIENLDCIGNLTEKMSASAI